MHFVFSSSRHHTGCKGEAARDLTDSSNPALVRNLPYLTGRQVWRNEVQIADGGNGEMPDPGGCKHSGTRIPYLIREKETTIAPKAQEKENENKKLCNKTVARTPKSGGGKNRSDGAPSHKRGRVEIHTKDFRRKTTTAQDTPLHGDTKMTKPKGLPMGMTCDEFDKFGWDHTVHFDTIDKATRHMKTYRGILYTLVMHPTMPACFLGYAITKYPKSYVVAFKNGYDNNGRRSLNVRNNRTGRQ